MTKQKLGASSKNQQKAIDAFMKVNFLFMGGSMFGGKSYLATVLSTLYARDPTSRIAVFRRTLEQMKKGGAIVDTFKQVYKQLGDECKLEVSVNPLVGKIVSGSGAGDRRGDGCKIDFIQMSSDKDMESIRGAAFNLAIIEEAIPDFTQEQIEFVLARLRNNSNEKSTHNLGSKLLVTGNPDPDSFMCTMIKDYYLDQDGYPIQDRMGDIRYFLKVNGEYIWGDTKDEVYDKACALGRYSDEHVASSKEDRLATILSFSFVQLTIKDNPIGRKNNPSYMAQLEAMDEVKKARNLHGNWFIRPEGAGVFDRKWLVPIRLKDIPKGCVSMRGIDKAHTIPSENNPNPDFTAISPLILKDKDGFYYLLGNYLPQCSDEVVKSTDKKVIGRFRRLAGARDVLIVKQLKFDKDSAESYGYSEPRLVVPKDLGAGTGDYNATLAIMLENGIKTVKDMTVSNVSGKKLLDFSQFTAACQNGLVFIVEESFDKDSLNYIFSELEKFDGVTKSTQTRKDDFVDAISIGFNAIVSARRPTTIPAHLNYSSEPTISADLLNRISNQNATQINNPFNYPR